MSYTDLTWMIGGPQGSGVDSSATLFARAAVAAGYWVYGKREYHSNIKGEHSYFVVRVKTTPVHSNTDPVHLLATFEPSTAQIHADEVVGGLIYDPAGIDPAQLPLANTASRFALPYDALLSELAAETGKTVTDLAIYKNTMAVAASCALLGIPLTAIETALKSLFTGGKAKLVAPNLNAAQKAMAAVAALPGADQFEYRLVAPENPPAPGSRLVLNGAVATALGKLKAGCRMQTYYSITPAVDECIYLEEHPEYGTVVFQCEDELAAINMAIGAATTGIRASTSTSGPGFSLMAEGLGWAGINEVPVVVFNYQRGGPSTGLPTRHEQADLLFALHAGHGEFPRLLVAPGDLHEYFHDAFEAFNWADRYQTPVIVLTDKAVANNTQSIERFDEGPLRIDRGELVISDPGLPLEAALAQFPRFAVTESGISPRPVPGNPGTIYWMTGDEHTELGHITEEPEMRIAMHTKRMKKLDLAAAEIPQDRQFKLYGPPTAPLTVVSWGSTKGAILDAMAVLAEQGVIVNFLQIRLMSPFPVDGVTRVLSQAQQLVGVEANYTAQLCRWVRMNTGIDIPHLILKYTGRPMSETELVAALKTVIADKPEQVVLTYGR
jgi:2-oxoglutarate ferredoxin oxidoreductase subunit alpha